MNSRSLLSIATGMVALTLLAACASTPRTIAELEAARAEVQQASAEPLAQQAAGIRLKQANEALQLAEESARTRKPLEQIRQQSYVAQRNAQIAREQTAELRARQEVEQGEAERNRVLLEARTAEARAAQAQAAVAQQQAASAQLHASATAEEAGRLRSELEQLQAKPTERGMVLTLGDVLFDTGRATLRSGAMLTVDRLADFLRNRPTLGIVVEGHTDSVGSDEYNLDLSQRRADTVRQALISRGAAGERVMARGLGEAFPVATNDNAGGRQQNRRVEVVFSDEQGNFLPGANRPSQ